MTSFSIGSDKTRNQDAMLTPDNLHIDSSRKGDFAKRHPFFCWSIKLTTFQAEGIWLLDVFKSAPQEVASCSYCLLLEHMLLL